MDYSIKVRNLFILILILAILFHIIFLSFLFLQFTKFELSKEKILNYLSSDQIKDLLKAQHAIKEEKLKKINEQQERAELRAKKTNFGLPVSEIFNEEKAEVLETEKEKIVEEKIEQKTIENLQGKKELIAKTNDLNIKEHKETKEIAEPQKETIKEEQIIEKNIATKKKKQGIMSKLMQNKRSQVIPGLPSFIGPAGEHVISRSGNKNLVANEEDLRQASYISKIAWTIQNSWHIKNHQLKMNNFDPIILTVTMTIDKDGNLKNLEKLFSSRYKEIDDLILETIRYSAPFPPIPKHLKTDIFIYSPSIYVYSIKENNFNRFSVFGE